MAEKNRKVEQVGLPGPGRVADKGHRDENQKPGGGQAVKDLHQRQWIVLGLLTCSPFHHLNASIHHLF
jgi:hypothetical protein